MIVLQQVQSHLGMMMAELMSKRVVGETHQFFHPHRDAGPQEIGFRDDVVHHIVHGCGTNQRHVLQCVHNRYQPSMVEQRLLLHLLR
jgi:hypothetical protein